MGLREKFFAADRKLGRVAMTITLHGEEYQAYASDLTGRQRIEFEKFYHGQLDDKGRLTSSTAVAAKLVQLGLVDEDSAPVFKVSDHNEICEKLSSQLIEQIAREVGLVSGIYSLAQDEDQEAEESILTLDDDDPHTAGLSPKNDGCEPDNSLS